MHLLVFYSVTNSFIRSLIYFMICSIIQPFIHFFPLFILPFVVHSTILLISCTNIQCGRTHVISLFFREFSLIFLLYEFRDVIHRGNISVKNHCFFRYDFPGRDDFMEQPEEASTSVTFACVPSVRMFVDL